VCRGDADDVDVAIGGDAEGDTGRPVVSAAGALLESRVSRYDLSRLRCPSVVSPVTLIVCPKCRMTAESSLPFTVLASAGVRVAGSRGGRWRGPRWLEWDSLAKSAVLFWVVRYSSRLCFEMRRSSFLCFPCARSSSSCRA
jgi:hypothetical protein